MRKSDSVRLGLRIFTAKENEKNSYEDSDWSNCPFTERPTEAPTYILQKGADPSSHFMAFGTAPFSLIQELDLKLLNCLLEYYCLLVQMLYDMRMAFQLYTLTLRVLS